MPNPFFIWPFELKCLKKDPQLYIKTNDQKRNVEEKATMPRQMIQWLSDCTLPYINQPKKKKKKKEKI